MGISFTLRVFAEEILFVFCFDFCPGARTQTLRLISQLPTRLRRRLHNAIFKNRAQNIKYIFDCVARSAVLLKPNVANIILFNLCTRIRSIWPYNDRHCLYLLLLAHFRRKIMPLDQNPHQTVTCASAFQCMHTGFLWPNCNNFACLHTRHDQN